MAEHNPSTAVPAPLRSALKPENESDRTPPASCTLKAVQIAEPVPELEDDATFTKRHVRTSSHRLCGKPATPRSTTSDGHGSPALRPVDDSTHHSSHRHHAHHHQYYAEKLLAQVSDWLEHEKKKKITSRKSKSHRRKSKSPPEQGHPAPTSPNRERSGSVDSQSSDVSFEKLEHILHDSLASLGLSSIPQHPPKLTRRRRTNSKTTLQRAASSDTDFVDGDAIVPSCDAWLDNSKTLSYTGGGHTEDSSNISDKAEKDNDPWLVFKNEIIRIAHTLRLKGWRRIPLGSGDTIDVERLSGALTNAVYVVTPPKDCPEIHGKKSPTKVLLRVYGPQAEHLIDRENELKVLQRLARKKIGPRLLGTFQNGRFEQFFNAITLQPAHLREPDTMRSIAKRMRELHEGIELLPLERDGGPAVWKNWDSWFDNVSKIVAYLDAQVEKDPAPPTSNSVAHAWKSNGYVCGVRWELFRDIIVKYRAHLDKCYKSKKAIKERLVFAHNDTQYGNILRIKPDDEKSPLLQPANKHKQLIVIDFEYSAASVPGQEFANHFSEWTYNYHDPVASHACNAERYPTVEEQHRFIKAYVDHRPQFPAASSTPRMHAQDSPASSTMGTPSLNPTPSSSSIVDFMLDARVPSGGWTAAERAREEQSDLKVRELMDEARLWRPANSAFWVAWGIVQAKIPSLDGNNDPVSEAEALKAEAELGPDEFDYLSYSQDRAFFFWGDIVQMGLIKPEELPEQLRSRLKIVEY